MKQNGNKIRYMKYKGSLKLAAAVLAVSLAFPMAAQAKAWDFETVSYTHLDVYKRQDYVNAHGTSTHHNDLFETKAIKLALGAHANKVKIKDVYKRQVQARPVFL